MVASTPGDDRCFGPDRSRIDYAIVNCRRSSGLLNLVSSNRIQRVWELGLIVSVFWKCFAIYQIVSALYLIYAGIVTDDLQVIFSISTAVGWVFIPVTVVVVFLYAFNMGDRKERDWLGLVANLYAGYASYTATNLVLQSWTLLSENAVALILAWFLLVPIILTAIPAWLAMRRYARGRTLSRT